MAACLGVVIKEHGLCMTLSLRYTYLHFWWQLLAHGAGTLCTNHVDLPRFSNSCGELVDKPIVCIMAVALYQDCAALQLCCPAN